MRSIEQILFLSKNPHYKLTDEEERALDDFLSKKSTKAGTKQQKRKKSTSDSSTRVRVRNIVPRTVPKVKEAPEDESEVS